MTSNSAAVELRPRSVGEVLGLTLDLYRRNFPLFVGIAAVVVVPTMILLSISQLLSLGSFAANPGMFAGDTQAATDALAGNAALLSLGSSCVVLLTYIAGVFWPWMEGALVHNVIERVLGRTPGLRASYNETRPRFGSLWGANALAMLAISILTFVVAVIVTAAIGVASGAALSAANEDGNGSGVVVAVTALLCTPVLVAAMVFAVVLSINWSFRAQAIVGEGADGTQALSRSNELSRGNRWRLFGRYLLLDVITSLVVGIPTLIVAGVIVAAYGASFASLPSNPTDVFTRLMPMIIWLTVLSLALSFITMLILTPLSVAYRTINYLDLRIRKENLAAAMAAATPNGPDLPVVAPPVAVTPSMPVVAPPTYTPTATPDTPTALPTQATPVLLPTDLGKLTPGQRIGVLFNRLRTEGDNAQVLNDLGMAYMEVGDFGGAMDALTRARAIAPNNADVVFNLMSVYLNRRDMRMAKQLMQEYVRLEDNAADLAAVRSNPRYKDLID